MDTVNKLKILLLKEEDDDEILWYLSAKKGKHKTHYS